MTKLFITGGTGFFGKAILKHYKQKNLYNDFQITLLTRNKSNFLISNPQIASFGEIKIVEGDILKPESLPSCDFEYIIHAATDSTIGPELPVLDRSKQIVEGTKNILEWSIRSNVKRFLYVSSGGVYGKIENPVLESQNSTPDISNIDNTYSISKLFSEHLCFLYGKTHNIDFSIIRCFSFIGEDLPLNKHFAIGNFILNVTDDDIIEIKGDGSPVRSYMDQRDLANWIFSILKNGSNGQIYNVGSDEEISILDLAKLINNLSKRKNQIIIKGKVVEGQSYGRNYYVPNIDKAKSLLGLRLNFTLKESILHVLDHIDLKNKTV